MASKRSDFRPTVTLARSPIRWLAAGGSESGLLAMVGWTRTDMLVRYARATAAERAADEARRLNPGDLTCRDLGEVVTPGAWCELAGDDGGEGDRETQDLGRAQRLAEHGHADRRSHHRREQAQRGDRGDGQFAAAISPSEN